MFLGSTFQEDMADEVEETASLDTSSDTIPEHLWKIFPPCGSYIRPLLEFCGYATRNSILELKTKEKQDAMISFARENHTCLSEEAKEKTFGMFALHPEKLCILPGLQNTFNEFLQSIDGKSVKSRNSQSGSRKRKLVLSPPSTSASIKTKKTAVHLTAENVRDQMKKWTKGEKMKEKNIKFEITSTEGIEGFGYKCLLCNWFRTILLEDNGKMLLSNIQHH